MLFAGPRTRGAGILQKGHRIFFAGKIPGSANFARQKLRTLQIFFMRNYVANKFLSMQITNAPNVLYTKL